MELLLFLQNYPELCQPNNSNALSGSAYRLSTDFIAVPQGCVLGPLLFIFLKNDMDVGLSNLIPKFADDTYIGNSIITYYDRMSF